MQSIVNLTPTQQKIVDSIENEYNIITSSFTNLSKYFTNLSVLSTSNSRFNFENNPISIPTNQLKPTELSLTEMPKTEPKKEEVVLAKKSRRRFNTQSRRKIVRKKITFGRVFPTQAYDEGYKAIGFKVFIQFLDITEVFGPFRDYSLATLLKNNLLLELSKLDAKSHDIIQVVRKHLEDLKKQIYNQFPPMETYKDIKNKNIIEEKQ